jgi:hypothetical protein
MKDMKSIFIGIALGTAFYTLYTIGQRKKEQWRMKQKEEQGKKLLFDAPVSRRCECHNQYCTCGKHVL